MKINPIAERHAKAALAGIIADLHPRARADVRGRNFTPTDAVTREAAVALRELSIRRATYDGQTQFEALALLIEATLSEESA